MSSSVQVLRSSNCIPEHGGLTYERTFRRALSWHLDRRRKMKNENRRGTTPDPDRIPDPFHFSFFFMHKTESIRSVNIVRTNVLLYVGKLAAPCKLCSSDFMEAPSRISILSILRFVLQRQRLCSAKWSK